jgi:hypothetical protein
VAKKLPYDLVQEQYRRRRFEIFETWSNSKVTFRELAEQFGLKPAYARELIWKIILHEGGQSERARAFVAKLDRRWKGAQLSERYETGSLGRKRNTRTRVRPKPQSAVQVSKLKS